MQPTSSAAAEQSRAWYLEWFDSPYYDLLYRYRDEGEAHRFIDALLAELQPAPGARILDLACGKGRYSRYLAEKGFEVTGLDLSVRSIEYARQFETERLTFYTHDMRLPFRTNYYDYIFNFFTSFGYFETEYGDVKTLRNVRAGLRPNGVFVLDFFNSQYVTDRLMGNETRVVGGVAFKLHKSLIGRHVVKTIRIADQGESHFFREQVRLYDRQDFERLFGAAGLKIARLYGDYRLNSFDLRRSPRIILVVSRQ